MGNLDSMNLWSMVAGAKAHLQSDLQSRAAFRENPVVFLAQLAETHEPHARAWGRLSPDSRSILVDTLSDWMNAASSAELLPIGDEFENALLREACAGECHGGGAANVNVNSFATVNVSVGVNVVAAINVVAVSFASVMGAAPPPTEEEDDLRAYVRKALVTYN